MRLQIIGSLLASSHAAGWTKIAEAGGEDGLGYCAVEEHHESDQGKNYVGSKSTSLFKTGCGGDVCTMADVATARATCASRCDKETNFACIMYSIGISRNKKTVFCVGSAHMPTMTTTKQDAECWTNHDSPHNCNNWDCGDWCALYDEKFTSQFEAAGCLDDGNDVCKCGGATSSVLPAPFYHEDGGRKFYEVNLDSTRPPSEKNIAEQCGALGLQPVCANTGYNDGRCYAESEAELKAVKKHSTPGAWFVLGQSQCAGWRYNIASFKADGSHKSYLNFHQFANGCKPPPSTGECGDTFCSDHPLHDTTNTLTNAEIVGTAVCTARYAWTPLVDSTNPYFTKWGHDFFTVSSAKMDAGSIVDACKARGMKPMCHNRWWTSRTGTGQECWLPAEKAELVVPAALPKSIVGLYTYIGSIHGGSMIQSGTTKVGYTGEASYGSTICVAKSE